MDAPILGDFCKFYCDTGSSATPVWTEWGEIDGCDCPDLKRNSTEVKVRMLNATPSLPGKIGALTFTFVYYPGFNDTNYGMLVKEFFATPTVRKWAMMTGEITTSGSCGMVIPSYIEGIPYHQKASEVVSHDVTLKYGLKKEGASWLEPEWSTIA